MRSKITIISVLALLGFVLAPATAGAQSVAQAKTVTVTPFLNVSFGTSDIPAGPELGSSLGLGAAIGYDWTPNMGFEFELGRVFDVAGDTDNLDYKLTTINANFIYHFDVIRVTPYATAGLGWVRANPDFEPAEPAENGNGMFDASTEVAWNFGGGLKVPIGNRMLARADLRRFQVNDDVPDHWRLYGGLTFWIKR